MSFIHKQTKIFSNSVFNFAEIFEFLRNSAVWNTPRSQTPRGGNDTAESKRQNFSKISAVSSPLQSLTPLCHSHPRVWFLKLSKILHCIHTGHWSHYLKIKNMQCPSHPESEFSNLMIECLSEFENILACLSNAHLGSNQEKIEVKILWHPPLNALLCQHMTFQCG